MAPRLATSLRTCRSLKALKWTAGGEVAKIGLDAMMRGQAVVVSGLVNTIMAQGVRFAPRSVVRKMAKAAIAST